MASSPLSIVFAGTPLFAASALEALIHSPHKISAVFTQPDRPAGRGLQVVPGPVKALALQHQLPVFQPLSLKDTEEQKRLIALQADVMVVAAYGMLLPSAVLSIPRFGCINIHPSLLPRWRGAAPIQRAIFAGDKTTGVTIMQMDAGLDTGPILLQRVYAMDEQETAQTLHDKMAALGAECLITALDLLTKGVLLPIPQDNQFATYAAKITKEEALLDWQQSALDLEYKIRAFNPKPVAYAPWRGERLRVWLAKAISDEVLAEVPGTLLRASSEGLDVATGCGILRLLEVQLPGGKRLNIADFYRAKSAEFLPGFSFSS